MLNIAVRVTLLLFLFVRHSGQTIFIILNVVRILRRRNRGGSLRNRANRFYLICKWVERKMRIMKSPSAWNSRI